MMTILGILGWLFFSVAAGMFAHHRRNRSEGGWFAIALLFSPLVAFVLLAILPPGASLLSEEAREQNFRNAVHASVAGIVVVLALSIGWLALA